MRVRKLDGSETIYYTPEEKNIALDVSLTALASHLGYTPQRLGSHVHLKEMDSLVIYNDKTWNRWSGRGDINGGTQIDFMMAFGGADSVPDAIEKLNEFAGIAPKVIDKLESFDFKRDSSINNREMELPKKNSNNNRLFAYLIKTRGLSQEVVYEFVHKKLIYESADHHNIVYCGMDPEGNIKYAGLRGTADLYGKKFKMDVPGNDKNYGVNIVNKNNSHLCVFESVIDCMSYIDMTGDWESNKLILGMVEDNPLVQFLKDYDHICSIDLCLDNDEAGYKAIYGLTKEEQEFLYFVEDNLDEKIILPDDTMKKYNDLMERLEKKPGLLQKYCDKGYRMGLNLPLEGKDYNEWLNIQKEKGELPVKKNRSL